MVLNQAEAIIAAVKARDVRGAPINALSHSRVPYVPSNTALHAAVAGGPHLETVALLLSRGADPRIFDSAHLTPLHNAAFSGNVAIGEMLIAHGADVNAQETGGRTALAIAEERGHAAFAALLRRHGARE